MRKEATVNELERYLDRVCLGVAGSRSLRQHLRQELREHLEEAIERYSARGMSEEEAVEKAIAEFGKAEAVGEDLQEVYGRRQTTFLLETAMRWKETTMKTEWKWNLIAHACMVLTLTISFLFVLFTEVYILPKLHASYAKLELPLPAFCREFWGILLAVTRSWFVWLPLLIALAVVYEVLSKSDFKRLVRLAVVSLVTFVFTVTAILAASTVAVSFALLPVVLPVSQVEPLVTRQAVEVSRACRELEETSAREDWAAAALAAEQLQDAARELMLAETSVPLLAVLGRGRDLSEIGALLKKIEAHSGDVVRRNASGNVEALQHEVSMVQESFERLQQLVNGWPEGDSGEKRPKEKKRPKEE